MNRNRPEAYDRAIETWVSQLGADDPEVQAQAIHALVQLGQHVVPYLIDSLRSMERWYASVKALVRIGEPAVPALIEALVDPDMDVFAYEALYKIGNPAVPSLLQTLHSSVTAKRYWSAVALGTIGARSAIEPLQAMHSDPNEDVRKVAAEAVSQIHT